MILVTTAGKVGAETARPLAQRGEPVRVLVRDPEKATALAPITFHPLTVEEQTQAMVDIGLPGSLAAMNAQAVVLFADGDSNYVTDDVPSIHGRPARTFERFATDYTPAFS